MREYVVTLESIVNITHDVKQFRFTRPEGYRFTPGQATDVSVNKPGWEQELRPFTFTSLNEDPWLELTIKRYADHNGVTNLLHQLVTGDQLIIRDVWGAIEYRGPGYFMAGGAGITPFIAILRRLKRDGLQAGNFLFYSNKTSDDIIYEDELNDILGEHALFVLTREEKPGYEHARIDRSFFEKHHPDYSKHFYICGPDIMVSDISSVLAQLGANTESIIFEKQPIQLPYNNMKIYKTTAGIIVEHDHKFYTAPTRDWDAFVNDDHLYNTLKVIAGNPGYSTQLTGSILKPMGNQELWACGVTYLRSKIGRQEESNQAGGSDFYARVYEAERPEIFFKATAQRVVGPGEKLRIRRDSTWDVPEPELTLVVTSSGKIVGYTIGNDMSSRSIEGENPLHLPQAKTWDGCAAIGPCIYVPGEPLPATTKIRLEIMRHGTCVFEGVIDIAQMKRTQEELVSFLYRECSFPNGCYVMTGTGIVPGNDFTLASGDEIIIAVDGIGRLLNSVA